MFEIKHKDGLARICDFETPNGVIETPSIMPVINPNIELISPERLQKEFGSQILITNSYVIYKNKDLREKALEKGLHDMLDYSGSIMTDSGTFQAYVYGEVDITPEEIIKFQKDIGSDISTILDLFTEPEDPRNVVEEKVDKTIKRAEDAVEKYGDMDGYLSLPIQGSTFTDLREYSARKISELGNHFYPIGGVVPLMEDYRFKELAGIILASKKGLGPKGPVHLFGAGHPMIYPWAVLMGCDLFDSSSYAKYAKRGDMMFSTGTKNIDDIEHFSCHCPVCSSYTPEELKNEEKKDRNRLIAEHNLWVSFKEIEKIKQAIKEGNLWEMVERRVRVHPHLLESMESIYDWNLLLDYYEPRSRQKALFYTGSTTMKRPSIKRIQNYLINEYEPPQDGPTIFLECDESKKPYHRFMEDTMNLLDYKKVNLLVSTPIGPVPLELDEIYPVAQSIFPDYAESEIGLDKYLENKDISEILWWKGEETLEKIPNEEGMSFDEMKIYSVAEYQFCKGAGEVLTGGELSYVKNRKGRIRNVMLDGEHILSRRHYDGLFTLKKAGAMLLKENFDHPILRTQVTKDSAEYNSQGHNVFAKFVTDMWDELRDGDETIVVDEDDQLVATARTFLTKKEVEVFDNGLAARTREGFKKYKR